MLGNLGVAPYSGPCEDLINPKRRERVAPNLRRDPITLCYYGFKKIGGRRYRHSLGTTDRAVANGRLAA